MIAYGRKRDWNDVLADNLRNRRTRRRVARAGKRRRRQEAKTMARIPNHDPGDEHEDPPTEPS